MAAGKSKIIYTLTDEAPLQKVPNNLAELGRLTQDPDTNIIKLPNISASVPQLIAAVKELQARGYKIPDFPGRSEDRRGEGAQGPLLPSASAVPSTRCCAKATPTAARPMPSRTMPARTRTPWANGSQASRTHVSHMHHGDFYHGEKSMTLDKARDVKMELITKSGKTIVLKPKLSLLAGEIIDSMFMSKKALCEFYEKELEDCRETGILFSLHVKATMMKVSHPIVFGHCVKIYYKDAFEKHGKLFDELGINVNNGMVNLYDKIKTLPESKRDEIIRDLHACQEHRPRWRWSIRPRASPTSTRRTTSSSMPRCRR
jgi:isocitrate dehydrogenase